MRESLDDLLWEKEINDYHSRMTRRVNLHRRRDKEKIGVLSRTQPVEGLKRNL